MKRDDIAVPCLSDVIDEVIKTSTVLETDLSEELANELANIVQAEPDGIRCNMDGSESGQHYWSACARQHLVRWQQLVPVQWLPDLLAGTPLLAAGSEWRLFEVGFGPAKLSYRAIFQVPATWTPIAWSRNRSGTRYRTTRCCNCCWKMVSGTIPA